ncbi:class II aldolase/adducin family protein [Klebsiella pneumoniae]|uniref:Class II aldolase/adducin family protein n=1 Tax=Klebsiella pneumoniae TaxID=573 RepID=A0A2X3H2K1_KLEPN|nr:class II aldolase/adducin family protein [Klebsiella pneumoniae]
MKSRSASTWRPPFASLPISACMRRWPTISAPRSPLTGKRFYSNPKWKHFSRIRASDLLVLNADDEGCAARPDVDATAWPSTGRSISDCPTCGWCCICTRCTPPASPVWRRRRSCPSTRTRPAILTGSPSIPCTAGWRTPRQKAPGWRGCWQINAVCLMGNHGVLVTAPNIGEAFDEYLDPGARLSDPDHPPGQPASR